MFLLILLLTLRGQTSAAPSLTQIENLPTNMPSSTDFKPISPDGRSTWDIVWSCLAVIFACAWVTVHPNIPSPDERRWWRLALRRIQYMAWTILVPEIVIYWAMRQYLGARKIASNYRDREDRQWTTAHGHFLQMGGFLLFKGDHPIGVIVDDEDDSMGRFEALLRTQQIKFPAISKEEIEERSKSDGLSKIVAIGQTAWFILQCIVRVVEGLTITQLELVTVALAALNALMYFFWWDKPYNVQVQVPIYLIQGAGQGHDSEKQKSEEDQAEFVHRLDSRMIQIQVSQQVTVVDESTESAEGPVINIWADSGSSPKDSASNTRCAGLDIPRVSEDEVSCKDHESASSNTRKMSSEALEARIEPAVNLPRLVAQNGQHWSSFWDLVLWLIEAIVELVLQFAEVAEFTPYRLNGEMQVPIFYSLGYTPRITGSIAANNDKRLLLVSTIGIAFGAIHCGGWNLDFPSRTELDIWRISSTLTVSIPCILAAHSTFNTLCLNAYRGSNVDTFFRYIGHGLLIVSAFLMPIYLVARFALLLIAFLALRDIPEGAYTVVHWTTNLPHV